MKALAFVLFLAAATVQAVGMYAFDTSKLAPGVAHVFTVDDSVRVTIRRDGEVRHVTVERLGIRNEYKLERVNGVLELTWKDVAQGLVFSPHRILVDGVTLDGSLPVPSPDLRKKATYYICPKDQTMLRVPHSDHDGEFQCPVDGTPMKPSAGRTSPYFLLN